MELNLEYITKLMEERNWDQADLARALGVDRSTVCRIFNGNRGIGKKFIGKLLNAFPDKKKEDLFILPPVSSNGNGYLKPTSTGKPQADSSVNLCTTNCFGR